MLWTRFLASHDSRRLHGAWWPVSQQATTFDTAHAQTLSSTASSRSRQARACRLKQASAQTVCGSAYAKTVFVVHIDAAQMLRVCESSFAPFFAVPMRTERNLASQSAHMTILACTLNATYPAFESWQVWDSNPLYALLQETIYTQGKVHPGVLFVATLCHEAALH
eukprot:368383-Pelagomonas_calceolata.AAC.5